MNGDVSPTMIMLVGWQSPPFVPCCFIMRKETGNLQWTAAFLIPAAVGVALCYLVNGGVMLLGII